MIIGSGLLARAFYPVYATDRHIIIYAAGVSNSSCNEPKEFKRERSQLKMALEGRPASSTFVYFGTCSAGDPEMANSPYVKHKLEMEGLVQEYSNYLIFRLPQLAGNTLNPHTLLNFLYARIYRGELFSLWKKATRNVIDIDDVLVSVKRIIEQKKVQNSVLNIANPVNYTVTEIVETMELVVGKKAVFEVVELGSDYLIDATDEFSKSLCFDENYLKKVLTKYYGSLHI